MSIESTIQRLQDRVDIQEILYGYCRNADLLNAEGMTAHFSEDCVAAYVPASMGAAIHGRRTLIGFLRGYLPNTLSSSHHMTNVELIFDTPDSVTAHAYMYSWERFKGFPATADCHRWGRYEFRLLRTAAGWRVSRLQLLSAGEYGGSRLGEQFGRPWPPQFD